MANGDAASGLITPEMEAQGGEWGEEEASAPIAESDIRRWAMAAYWPEEPPRLFWDAEYAGATPWKGIVAPEDFNPFAWRMSRQALAAPRQSRGMAIDEFGVPLPNRKAGSHAMTGPRIGGMNAGRGDEFGERARPGDIVISRQRLNRWSTETTRLGPTLFAWTEIEWTNQDGALVRRRLQSKLRYFVGAVGEAGSGARPQLLVTRSDMPPWSRKTGLENWNRFAAVNDEFVDIHMDDEAGRQAGNPEGAFGMGNLRYAYIVNALRDWLSDRMSLRRLECQFRALNRKGDTLTVFGVLKRDELAGGERILGFDIDVANQRGESTCPGNAVVAVPAATAIPGRGGPGGTYARS